jgi:hypothetical protein|tara:strand:+ start:1337 stop:1858 length:522 start_codon:yes stop_codon:yes gene_type:complete
MAGSLELIKKVSGTSNVSSFDVTNVFSDKYDVYKIVSMIQTDAAFLEVPMRLLDSGGSEISAAEYDRAFLELRSSTTFGQGKGTGQTSIIRTMRTGTGAAATGNNVIYIHNPFDSSSFTFLHYQVAGWSTGTPQLGGQKGCAVHKSAETISGFKYFVSSDNITSHNVSVYGVK